MKRRILWLTVDVDDFLAFSSFSYDNNTQHGVKETKSFLFLVFPFSMIFCWSCFRGGIV